MRHEHEAVFSETTIYKQQEFAEENQRQLKPFSRDSGIIDPIRKGNNAQKVPEVMESKKFTKFHKKHFSKTETVPLESDMLLQHARLQTGLLHTESRLNFIRKNDNKRRVKIDAQWKELEEKELQFKENFIMFNQFNVENAEKRHRASKKLKDDLKLIEDRQKDVEKFLNEMKDIKILRNRMNEEIKKYNPLLDFLRGVTELVKEFTSSESIIRRFLELVEAKETLAKRTEDIFYILEGARDDLMKLIEEKNFIILGLNNQIANLQARYENANIKALESEALVTEIKNNAVKQMGEIDAVKNSIWNTYTHMAVSKKHKIKIKKERIEDQMMYINRTLTELVKVNKQIIAEQKKQQMQQNKSL